jgi:hypothetical protein
MYLDVVPACKGHAALSLCRGVVYKRIYRHLRKRGDIPNLIARWRKSSRCPLQLQDDEFIELAELKLAQGDREGAKKVMETSLKP